MSSPNYLIFTQTFSVKNWPVPTDFNLYLSKDTFVQARTDGRFLIQCRLEGIEGNHITFVSQPVNFTLMNNDSGKEMHSFPINILISVNKNLYTCFYINDIPVIQGDKTIPINVKQIQLVNEKLYETININNLLIYELEEFIFVHALQELEEKIFKNDLYSIIRASGLIRLLIGEEKPGGINPDKSLGLMLAKRYNIPVEFEILKTDRSLPEYQKDATTSLPNDKSDYTFSVYSNLYPKAEVEKISVDDFLNTIFLWTSKGSSTVYDLLKTMAETAGGIHIGAPHSMKDQKQRIIDFETNVQMLSPISIGFTKEIGMVTLKSFHALAQHIMSKGK